MLKPAQLYAGELNELFIKETWYNKKYMYCTVNPGNCMPDMEETNTGCHSFVSINDSGEIVGYAAYDINWIARTATNFVIIGFRNSVTFVRDVQNMVYDLFDVYNVNRLLWYCFVENANILKSYRTFIKKHGGRECAYYRQANLLQDGKLHDMIGFEIMKDEFRR